MSPPLLGQRRLGTDAPRDGSTAQSTTQHPEPDAVESTPHSASNGADQPPAHSAAANGADRDAGEAPANGADGPGAFDELLDAAGALERDDVSGLGRLAAAAAKADLSETESAALIGAAKRATKLAIALVRSEFAKAGAAHEREMAHSPEAIAERERAAREAELRRIEEEDAARRAVEEELARLEAACRDIALDPAILDRVADLVERIGIVGERAAVKASYIAATSRMLCDRAVSLLRRGAAASGKNVLVDAVLRLVPKEDVVRISSASPMALIYYGDDERALSHKVILIAEAAAIASKHNGDEHPAGMMLRTLLSEGRIDHPVAITQPSGTTPKTVHVQREGPVVVLMTSARDNVEPETFTRLLANDADESPEQTLAVVRRVMSGARGPDQAEIDHWLDYQRWLKSGAPYDVVVPFGEAISDAYEVLAAARPEALNLRIRRDMAALLSATKASAVLHRAQRRTDEQGRIIAEMADYEHVHAAVGQSVAALYGIGVRPDLIGVARAAKALGVPRKFIPDGRADTDSPKRGPSARLTVAALRARLGLSSHDTAARRLAAATEAGILEEDEARRGTGYRPARYFWLMQTAEELQQAADGQVFPAPADVARIADAENLFSDEGGEGDMDGYAG